MASYGLRYGLLCNSRLAGSLGGVNTPIPIYCATLGEDACVSSVSIKTL